MAEAVAGPTPFSSEVRAVTAFFSATVETRATVSGAADFLPAAELRIGGEGRCWNASRLLAFTLYAVAVEKCVGGHGYWWSWRLLQDGFM